MNSLYLAKTSKTPEVTFDPKSGTYEIIGRSIPENSVEFYSPIMQWLDIYQKDTGINISLVVKLEYFNTSSSKCLVDIFRKLEKMYQDGHQIIVKWYYEEEDEDMKESGEDFRDLLKLPLEMRSYTVEEE